jgi:outer membrane protein assembly factor BamB
LIQKGLAIGIVLLFLGSSIVTMMVPAERQEPCTRSLYDCYHRSDTLSSPLPVYVGNKVYNTPVSRGTSQTSDDGLMNSSWPMYCRDVHHTGQSPYTTVNTTGVEKWRIPLTSYVEGSPVIDKNGVIYVGGDDFFAVYPNGTIKWEYSITGYIWSSAPAIDENGIIYIGTIWASQNYLYAFYPNGTLKWRYPTSYLGDIYSSPVIGNDGTIYFGDEDAYINALYPNGTLKWRYRTTGAVLSSPAIGSDRTIYCGSHDGGLYALDPDTGVVIWRFATGGWVRTAPCIAEDGTIYCVSLDNYLYAIAPNGSMKWRTDVGAGTSPTIGHDGTIYAGWNKLYAVNPIDGHINWVYDPGSNRCIEGGTPAHSADGTIYCGVIYRVGGSSQGGEIVAINPDGTEKWRETIADYRVQSAPAISEDGTIYIGSSWNPDGGFLHAFGPLDPNAPAAPTIAGQANGRIKRTYGYTFTSTSPREKQIYYFIDWGDGTTTDWLGPYASGETLTLNHSWKSKGTYTVQARAKDTGNLWGPWGTLSVTMPCSYETPFQQFWMRLFDRFSNAFPILRHLLGGYQ